MLSINRSGYYAWIKRPKSQRQQKNELLDKKIHAVFDRHKGRYGSPRLTDELKEEGEICIKNRVARRMKSLGLRAKAKKKFKATTDSNHSLPVAPNVLNRDFTASAPNQKWVSDISVLQQAA